MRIEKQCVQRGSYCDRDCAHCDIVQDDKELIEAYEEVDNILSQLLAYGKIKNMQRRWY